MTKTFIENFIDYEIMTTNMGCYLNNLTICGKGDMEMFI